MRRYETIVILEPDLSQEQREPFFERVEDIIPQQGGFLIRRDEKWGDRKLAYEIRKKKRGYYVLYDYCGTGDVVNEMERFFRIDDRALKYMTVLLDKEADTEAIKSEMAAEAEKEAAQQEAAEAEAADSSDTPDEEPAAAEEKAASAESDEENQTEEEK